MGIPLDELDHILHDQRVPMLLDAVQCTSSCVSAPTKTCAKGSLLDYKSARVSLALQLLIRSRARLSHHGVPDIDDRSLG